MKFNKQAIGINLKDELQNKEMSQKELAEMLKISESAVSTYIKGKRTPRIKTLFEICNILGVSTSTMLMGAFENDRDTCRGCKYEDELFPPKPCRNCKRYYADFWERR